MIDDERLVEACLEGDARAFAVLVGRYRYPVYGLCLSYIRDFDAAEDAAQEALAALRRAYELGADDIQVVRAISGLCFRFGQHCEGGRFLEQAAARRDDWKESIGLLKSGIGAYYHAYYTGRGEYMEDCVRCHRRIRELAPAGLEPRRRLTLW